jgi:hypothetical protein
MLLMFRVLSLNLIHAFRLSTCFRVLLLNTSAVWIISKYQQLQTGDKSTFHAISVASKAKIRQRLRQNKLWDTRRIGRLSRNSLEFRTFIFTKACLLKLHFPLKCCNLLLFCFNIKYVKVGRVHRMISDVMCYLCWRRWTTTKTHQ